VCQQTGQFELAAEIAGSNVPVPKPVTNRVAEGRVLDPGNSGLLLSVLTGRGE
jgi:hypothetical protein